MTQDECRCVALPPDLAAKDPSPILHPQCEREEDGAYFHPIDSGSTRHLNASFSILFPFPET